MTQRLAPGSTAPEFQLPDSAGNTVSLRDYAGQTVIVYFYPAAMTPGCTKQAVDFQASLAQLQQAGFAVVGISPDPVEKLAKFSDSIGAEFPLLSDPDRTVLEAYAAYGMKKLYGKGVIGVLRSTFIVDVDDTGNGTIRDARYNVRAKGHVAKLLRELGV